MGIRSFLCCAVEKIFGCRVDSGWPQCLRKCPESILEVTVELLCEHLILNGVQPVFVQIGGFDGISNDPICRIAKKYALAGVVVEPQRKYYRALLKNYHDFQNVKCVNVAIGNVPGKQKLYSISAEALEKFPMSQQIASLSLGTIQKHQRYWPDIMNFVETHLVDVITFQDLIERAEMTSFDLLQIDAEGLDFEILTNVDLDSYRPAIISFEHKHLSRREINILGDRLVSKGYHLSVSTRGDTIAFREVFR